MASRLIIIEPSSAISASRSCGGTRSTWTGAVGVVGIEPQDDAHDVPDVHHPIAVACRVGRVVEVPEVEVLAQATERLIETILLCI